MCKFSSRLFVFLVMVPLLVLTRPASKRSLIDLLTGDNNYNLSYDQRQKGGENLRVKLDGFFIGLPSEPTGIFLMSDELVNIFGEELLLGRHGEDQSPHDESKITNGSADASDLAQKQLGNYQKAEGHKADSEELSQRAVSEERGDYNQGSRTKLYIMNLLDYIRRNRN